MASPSSPSQGSKRMEEPEARSGFVTTTTSPTAKTHLVGVHHPQNYETRFIEARREGYDGPQAQSQYGWTTAAGPRYAGGDDKDSGPSGAARMVEKINQETKHEKATNRWLLVKDEVQSPTSKTNVMRVFSGGLNKHHQSA